MFKPMLACSTIPALEDIDYPVIATPKLDGIRCLLIDGVAVSRALKPIPNKFIQDRLKGLHGFDGELMLKSRGDFNNVQSAVMSVHGEPDFELVVFDKYLRPMDPYSQRLSEVIAMDDHPRLRPIEQELVLQEEVLDALYDKWLSEGYEGAIVRDPLGPYKFGRSTLRQGWMLKLKTFHDAEAIVIGYEELLHNDNDATINELGYQVRSSHGANKYSSGQLGALIVKFGSEVFKIGTGFDREQRIRYWNNREDLIDRLVTFKYQELSSYGVPRFPVFKGFRDRRDV